MLKILVIEDEMLAAERLINLILQFDSKIKILDRLESVRSSIKWLTENEAPDLIFMDIQLADGLCFEIFNKVPLEVPVIFTTAYNEYALKAFKVNSIDYLLKPIDAGELENALNKFDKLKQSRNLDEYTDRSIISKMMQMIRKPYRTRFVVRIGEHIKAIHCEDIMLFYSSDKSTFIRTSQNRDFGIDYSLDQLGDEIDRSRFFRVNRKQIIALDSIRDIIAYSGSRLKIVLKNNDNEEVIVSREKVGDFKIWLEGN